MRRAALLLPLALAASCSSEATQSCPGESVGSFSFDGTVATTVEAALDPNSSLPECDGALGFPPALVPFEGIIAGDPASPAGALCRSTGAVLYGTHAGQRWSVEASSSGSVLAACGTTCAAISRVVIAGDVLPDLASAAEFRGVLVEQLIASEGACDACVLPCAARYVLLGKRIGP